jgi:E3 ubiquitin-protein ligase BRE1
VEKRDKDIVRLREQRDQQLTELSERKQRDATKHAAYEELKALSESRSVSTSHLQPSWQEWLI